MRRRVVNAAKVGLACYGIGGLVAFTALLTNACLDGQTWDALTGQFEDLFAVARTLDALGRPFGVLGACGAMLLRPSPQC